MPDVAWLFIAAPLLGIPVFIRFGLYRAIVSFLGHRAIWSVIQAVSLYALFWSSLALISGVQGHSAQHVGKRTFSSLWLC